MEYKIDGLTRKQVALLDIMWTLDDEQSVENFVRSLPRADQQQAQSLKTQGPHAFDDFTARFYSLACDHIVYALVFLHTDAPAIGVEI